MKKHLPKIIAVAVIAAVLVLAFFMGDSAPEETPTEETYELYTDETTEPAKEEPAQEVTAELEVGETPKTDEKTPDNSLTPPTETVEEEPAEPINSVSLTVDCSDILSNMDSLPKEKHGLIPDNGIIFSLADIEITEGESVFDVLKRTLIANGVHLEFNLTPVTNSAYIEGIGNIYEFDCGERSGWKFSVNGEYPRVGCSDYKVKPGDKIVFLYKIKAY